MQVRVRCLSRPLGSVRYVARVRFPVPSEYTTELARAGVSDIELAHQHYLGASDRLEKMEIDS